MPPANLLHGWPLYLHGLTVTLAWVRNHMPSKEKDENISAFPTMQPLQFGIGWKNTL